MQVTSVLAPSPPKSLADTGLNVVMMRDILLKTIFRMNLDLVSEIARNIALPIVLTQELIDLARGQKPDRGDRAPLHATSGNEMGYQLTEAGKNARARRAVAV